jgi:hypothetical protein
MELVGCKIEVVRPCLCQNRFVQENPGASLYNLESLKDFVRIMTHAVDGMEGSDTAALETVCNYWNRFSAGWRQKNTEIPSSIAESVTNVCLFHDSLNTFQSRILTTIKFIYGPLAAEMGLPAKKRPTRFANKSHLLHFARQLWKEDWFGYPNPSPRVDDWAFLGERLGHNGRSHNVFVVLQIFVVENFCTTRGEEWAVVRRPSSRSWPT